jgi:hypothetical protein
MRHLGRIVCVGLALALPLTAAAQTEWVGDPANPVLGPGDGRDAWSYVNEVVLVDGPYNMFYIGQEEGSPWDRYWDIGHATSPDGSDWTRDPANPIVVRGGVGEWDNDSVAFPAVIHDGTEFRMWYTGERDVDDFVWTIGYAESDDLDLTCVARIFMFSPDGRLLVSVRDKVSRSIPRPASGRWCSTARVGASGSLGTARGSWLRWMAGSLFTTARGAW